MSFIEALVNYFYDFNDYRQLIFLGIKNTLLLTVIVTITGFLGGLVLFFLLISKYSKVSFFAKSYVSFFIGTPLLAILFVAYYGLPQIGFPLASFSVAVLGFTLNISAYNATYLLASYQGLKQNQIQAAYAQGFNDNQIYWQIILPQSLRNSAPSLINQIIVNLKDSSIVFLIGFVEFFARMQELAAYNFQFFISYLISALVYLLLVLSFLVFFNVLRRIFFKSLKIV